MATEARKVSLIETKDYPKEDYSAYWEVGVGQNEKGFFFVINLMSYEPVAWLWEGKQTEERPDYPMPAYPPCHPSDAVCDARHIPHVPVELHLAHRDECMKIHAAHPKPVHLIEQVKGEAKTRDEADTAAQQWVLGKIENYRRSVK